MAKSTTDLTISCDQTGSAFAADVTQALIAINSAHRSSTEPTYNIEDGVMWLDTSSSDYKLKMRVGGQWKVLADLNGTRFESPSEADYVNRLDTHDLKHNGTVQSSPNVNGLKINSTLINASATEINYLVGVTGNIQDQIDQKNGYVHPTTPGWKHVPAGGTTNQVLIWSADGVAQWVDEILATPAADSVGQTELKTATGEFSVSGAVDWTDVTLPGGQYGFVPQFKVNYGETGNFKLKTVVTSTSYVTKVQMQGTIQGRQTYITASPPYSLGDGDIPLFVFLLLDSEGNVKSTYASIDPPWAYSGNTDIRPDYYDANGVGWKTVNGVLTEIDYDYKNTDMNAIPHPFTLADGDEVVMLNPFQSEMQNILDQFNSENDVCSMLNKITLTDGDFTSPPGVRAVNFSWGK